MKLQVVLDTNVLVAGLRSRRGASFELIRLIADNRFELNVSVALALEYEDVLKRPGLVAGITEEEMDKYRRLRACHINTRAIYPDIAAGFARSRRRAYPGIAVQCQATIVTHNTRDFDGAALFGVGVKTPSQFLRQLENTDERKY